MRTRPICLSLIKKETAKTEQFLFHIKSEIWYFFSFVFKDGNFNNDLYEKACSFKSLSWKLSNISSLLNNSASLINSYALFKNEVIVIF